jgi:pentatricopeptide repeat protein
MSLLFSITLLIVLQAAGRSITPGMKDCTQLIQALSSNPDENTIDTIWKYMKSLSPLPDATACVSVLAACRTPAALATGTDVHNYIVHHSLLSNFHKVKKSNHITNEQHLVLFTALMNMYRQCGQPETAISLWHEMRSQRIPLNRYVFCTLLGVCTDLKNLQAGEEIYEYMQHRHIKPDIALYNALIYFFVKCGIPNKAIFIWQHL